MRIAVLRTNHFERELRERPDAVVVALPSDRHEEATLAALDAGAHVLLAPPLAHSLESAERIAAAAKKARRLVMLDLPLRGDGAARTVKRYLDSGRCGPLYHASTYWCRSRGVPAVEWKRVARHSGGGALVELGIHRLDLTLWLLGDPAVRSVFAFKHTRLGRCDVEDFAGGVLRLAGGGVLLFEFSWAENSGRREVSLTRILGLRGGAEHRNRDHGHRFWPHLYVDRRGELTPVAARQYARPAADKKCDSASEFVRAIRTGARDVPDAARGVALQRIVAALQRSAAEEREISVSRSER